MSWFGEQLSSFTEKITDITKEILIDEPDQRESPNATNAPTYKELLELCREKDEKINNLLSEKEYLESNIEELDRQHQEALEAVLLQKSQVVSENNDLKKKLDAEKHKQLESAKGDFQFSYGNSDISDNLNANVCENHSTELLRENINLISILQSVSDCSEDEKFKKQVDWLEKQKDLIVLNNASLNTSVNKIDTYISFLEALHSQSLYSVVDEICSIFNSLVFENSNLKEKLALVSNAENSVKSNNSKNSSCEANNQQIKLERVDSEAQTVAFNLQTTAQICENSKSSQAEIIKPSVSNYIQTDSNFGEEVDSLLKKESLIAQLESKNLFLEEEKHLIQEKVDQLQSRLNKETSHIKTQTDNTFENSSNELLSAQRTIEQLKHDYCALQEGNALTIKNLNRELEASAFTVSEQQTKIDSLKDEIKSLGETIHSLKLRKDSSEVSIELDKMPIQKTTIQPLKVEEIQKSSISETEMTLLQTRLKTSELEKGRLLCVLNEKTQECSSLKAEVHKLTNIVSSEKQALMKLQQDIFELKQSNGENSDPELTKEAIKKLSTIIKDKDLEIDSLTQKNSSLTTLIQNDAAIPEQLQALADEKMSLSKELSKYKAERDKIMLSYNTKDKEWREHKGEVKKLNGALTELKEKFDALDQSHTSVVQQYEEKQKSLINTQNELVRLKQRVSELEQELMDVKTKHTDLLNSVNANDVIQITKEELHEKDCKLEKLTCGNVEKDHLIQEKDCMIHDLSQQVKKLKLESGQQVQMSGDLHEKISNLTERLKSENLSLEQVQREKVSLEQRLQDRTSELELLKDMNERLNMSVKEKEFSIQSMTEKISSLSQYISSDSSSSSADVNQILAESETMFSEAQKFRRERDESLLALNQSKQETQSLKNEIQRLKSNEIHLESQLSRLRQHLLEVEENYTNEALKAEEREKKLKEELFEVNRRADINSSAVVDTNQRASIQIASLQEQLSMVATQRDETLAQISSLEDKVLQHSTSVNKLQLVLEQMQKSNERKIKEVDNKWQTLLQSQKEANQQLEKQLQIKKMQLEESSRALEAASRLSEQLDAKEEIISTLKRELWETENKIKSTALEISSIRSNTEGKVDRIVMKSLVLGYFSTPPNQKSEVIRLLARVLDFNQEEMEKAGIVVGRQTRRQDSKGGIFSSIFNRLPSLSSAESSPQPQEKSFTTLFVQFLENESQPIVPMPFPAEKMAEEQKSKTQLKKKPETVRNPSPLLLDIESAFPTFTPVAAVEYSVSPAPAILKEVLE